MVPQLCPAAFPRDMACNPTCGILIVCVLLITAGFLLADKDVVIFFDALFDFGGIGAGGQHNAKRQCLINF
tara:strand:+ start:8651 stop:8863 length:213 start_codon:yes stop_codon:yes gene_type:complete